MALAFCGLILSALLALDAAARWACVYGAVWMALLFLQYWARRARTARRHHDDPAAGAMGHGPGVLGVALLAAASH